MSNFPKSNGVLLLSVLCALLVIMNVGLQLKNNSLRKQVEFKERALQVSVGDVVPALTGLGLHGQSVSFPVHPGSDELVLVLSRTCAFCDRNWHNWEQLLSRKLPVQPILVDLSMGAREDYLSAHHVTTMPFIHEVNPNMLAPYKLSLTPQTILVGTDSKVRGVWTGELTSGDIEDISRKLVSDAASPQLGR
jgi:hypothetical protein